MIALFPHSQDGCICPCLVRVILMTVLSFSTAFFFSAKHTVVTKQSSNPSADRPFQVRGVDMKSVWLSLVWLRLGWSFLTGVASSHCFYLLLYKGTDPPNVSRDRTYTHIKLKKTCACSRSLAHFWIVTNVFQKSSSSTILSIIYMEF